MLFRSGEKWVSALYQRGGWSEVSQAFTTLPQSTEQILHPEKYFTHEAPVRVTLPDISALLNARDARVSSGRWAVGSEQNSSRITHHSSLRQSLLTAHRSLPTSGWRRLDYDVQGEWDFYLILDQFLKSPVESRRAAAGWGGDRFEVYEGPKGEVLYISLSTWDTENDAREFFDAYVKRTQLRYSDTTPLSSTDAKPLTPDSRAFHTSEGGVVIDLLGDRVLVVEGYPRGIANGALEQALWK